MPKTYKKKLDHTVRVNMLHQPTQEHISQLVSRPLTLYTSRSNQTRLFDNGASVAPCFALQSFVGSVHLIVTNM